MELFSNVSKQARFFVNFCQLQRVRKDEGVLEILSLENKIHFLTSDKLLILPLQ